MIRPSRVIHNAVTVLLGTAGLTIAGLAAVGVNPAAGQPATAASAWPAHVFAPYVDTGLSNATLTTAAYDDGTRYFTLAFVDGPGCQWSLPDESSWPSQITALQAEGGNVSISFGGYTADTDGTDLGSQCSSGSAMAAQVESVVTTLNVTHLDFDIESSEETDQADYTRTAQALAQVRSWATANGEYLTISYTLPVLPTGLTQAGLGVLDAATASGFTPDIVNVMTMDYGSAGTEMGTAADQALAATATQLQSVFGISSSAAYAMLGDTPMIGQNDTPGETFTLTDAATVESYAAQQGIALLSFWSEGRDNGGCPGTTTAEATCSGIGQADGAFAQAFQPFTGGGGSPTPPATSTPTAIPTPAASGTPAPAPIRAQVLAPLPIPVGGSCVPAWNNATVYVSGDEVSYNGNDWNANQWSDDEAPGGASGAWTNNGPC